jgi:murein L,D-transpeptidase YcbB/YkuD
VNDRAAGLLLGLTLLANGAGADVTPAGLQQHLAVAGAAWLVDQSAVEQFYRQRDYTPVWSGPHCASHLAELREAVNASAAHGLNPEHYHSATLSQPTDCDVQFEALATDAWLSLASNLYEGRLEPQSLEPGWSTKKPEIDLAALLLAALDEGKVREALLELAPGDSYYRALQKELLRLQQQTGSPGLELVDDGPLLRRGGRGIRVQQLRQRLTVDALPFAGPGDSALVFDAELENAVKAFQRRANLEPDGIVGPMTLAQLNRSVADRIGQLRVNLERWRWLPKESPGRHIRINIADFQLQTLLGAEPLHQYRIIVGTTERPTPVFSGQIKYIVLNPWWEAPRRIAVKDKLPMFKSDPSAIDRLGYVIMDAQGHEVDGSEINWSKLTAARFPYRLRQKPGPLNALGQVKLIFPNSHDVYLHDTPTRGLFARTRRAFSSGCMRVENALELTAWVLAETTGWDTARINTVVVKGFETRVTLSDVVPIQLLYLTAVLDETGEVRLIDDLYLRDPAVLAALDEWPGSSYPERAGAETIQGDCVESVPVP